MSFGMSCTSSADNYLVKPVEQSELLACIQSLARRIKQETQGTGDILSLHTQRLCLEGPRASVSITHGEAMLLAGFIRAAGHRLERWQAMQLIDPDDKGLVAANLEMRISALRKKLSACGASGDAILTLRNFGYALGCPIRLV